MYLAMEELLRSNKTRLKKERSKVEKDKRMIFNYSSKLAAIDQKKEKTKKYTAKPERIVNNKVLDESDQEILVEKNNASNKEKSSTGFERPLEEEALNPEELTSIELAEEDDIPNIGTGYQNKIENKKEKLPPLNDLKKPKDTCRTNLHMDTKAKICEFENGTSNFIQLRVNSKEEGWLKMRNSSQTTNGIIGDKTL
ncbi:hypothetical protein C2G38_2174037 [Gigaspora rosea]|uniref:Uncharacterized protein n=1 Tax=Gigaspora rosea TaxID=44941 RepID=A0A397VTP9_9GLOM|nr:hypothetical protein C2G38_2174037 [Gigaspora rosea]